MKRKDNEDDDDDDDEEEEEEIKTCAQCDKDENDFQMVKCKRCSFYYHIYCLPQPLNRVPRGEWNCPDCLEKKARITKRQRTNSVDEDGAVVTGDSSSGNSGSNSSSSNSGAESDRSRTKSEQHRRRLHKKSRERESADIMDDSDDGEIDEDNNSNSGDDHGSDSDSEDDHLNSLTCSNCQQGKDEDKILLCDSDGCERGYHIYCLRYKLDAVPKGKWICDHCRFGDLSDVDLNDEEDDEDIDALIRRKKLKMSSSSSSLASLTPKEKEKEKETESNDPAKQQQPQQPANAKSPKSSPPISSTKPPAHPLANADDKTKSEMSKSSSSVSKATSPPQHSTKPPSSGLKKPSISKPTQVVASKPPAPSIPTNNPNNPNNVNHLPNNSSAPTNNSQQPNSNSTGNANANATAPAPTPTPTPSPVPVIPTSANLKKPSIINDKKILKSPAALGNGIQLLRSGSKDEIDSSYSILDMVPNSKTSATINPLNNISWDLGGGYSASSKPTVTPPAQQPKTNAVTSPIKQPQPPFAYSASPLKSHEPTPQTSPISIPLPPAPIPTSPSLLSNHIRKDLLGNNHHHNQEDTHNHNHSNGNQTNGASSNIELVNDLLAKSKLVFEEMFVSVVNIIKLNSIEFNFKFTSSLVFQKSQLSVLPSEIKQSILAPILNIHMIPHPLLLIQPSVDQDMANTCSIANGAQKQASSSYYSFLLKMKRNEFVGSLQVSDRKHLYIFSRQITSHDSKLYGWSCDSTMLFGIVFCSSLSTPSPSPSPSPSLKSSNTQQVASLKSSNSQNQQNNQQSNTLKGKNICFLGYGEEYPSLQLVKSLLEGGAQASNTLETDSNLLVIEPSALKQIFLQHPELATYKSNEQVQFIKGTEYLTELVSKLSKSTSTSPNTNSIAVNNSILFPQNGIVIVDYNMLIENELLFKRLVPLLSNLRKLGKQWSIQIFKGAYDELKSISQQSNIQQRLEEIQSHINNKILNISQDTPRSPIETLSKAISVASQFIHRHTILLSSNRILIDMSKKFPVLSCFDLVECIRYIESVQFQK